MVQDEHRDDTLAADAARLHAASRLDLVADIGGTNSRFALSDPDADTPALLTPRTLRNDGFDSLESALACYLQDLPRRPARAAIAVASPVDRDDIRLTNLDWSFRRSTLAQRVGLDEVRVLNDFGAVARAVPVLTGGDLVHIAGPERGALAGPVSVIGPGTGLGVALLAGSGDAGSRDSEAQFVETEGGHASYAPLDDVERDIERSLRERHGRVSIERVLCGEGLAHIDRVLRARESGSGVAAAMRRDPAEVTAAALAGSDAFASAAVARFCAILGSVAGDIALLHGARTLVIAGGIVPRFVAVLRDSDFRARMIDKGRMGDYLRAVAVYVVTHAHPGLLGAAQLLRGTRQVNR